MNWEAIGAVGETVGALAVLVTLVYLAVQIRQNTKAVRAAAVDSTTSHLSKIREVYLSTRMSQICIEEEMKILPA
jgi:hypothetical protein